MRRLASVIGVAALAAAPVAGVSMIVATPADAHDVLVASSPEDRSTVSEPPDAVELTFNNPVSTEFAQVVVLDADDTEHQQGAPEVVGTTVTQPVDALPNGAYSVSYRIVSSDGHPISGTISFTVAAAGGDAPAETGAPTETGPPAETGAPAESEEAVPTPTTAATSDDDGIGTMAVVLIIAGAVIVVAGIAYLAGGGRLRGSPEDTETR